MEHGKSLRLSSSSVAVITFGKLVAALVLSMCLSNWWVYGGDSNDVLVDSCSNPSVSGCFSVCGDVQIVNVVIGTDDYTIDDDMNGYPTIQVHSSETNDPYCIAEFRGSCAYVYWYVFKLVPVLFHLAGFLLQCIFWWKLGEFNPQQRQYNRIVARLYPELIEEDLVVRKSVSMRVVLEELTQRPADSIFAFLEILTCFYVWGELLFPPIYCGMARPLSLYYYPILMSLLDLSKFNVYVATQFIRLKEFDKAAMCMFNLEMLTSNIWITLVIAGAFMFGLGKSIVDVIIWRARWLLFICTGTSDAAWPRASTDEILSSPTAATTTTTTAAAATTAATATAAAAAIANPMQALHDDVEQGCIGVDIEMKTKGIEQD